MIIIEVAISTILALIATIHILWGIGLWFPIRDENELVRAVIGVKGAERMPGPIPCALVAAGLIIVIMTVWTSPSVLRNIILISAGLIFFIRGAATYTKKWRRLTPQEPFAKLDRAYYGPLCLILGLGMFVLVGSN